MSGFFIFRLNITSWACLLAFGLKIIFHWKAHSLILFKFSLSSRTDRLILWITENKDIPLANNLTLDGRLLDKWIIWIRNNNELNIDTCGFPALTLVQVDTGPLRIILCIPIT